MNLKDTYDYQRWQFKKKMEMTAALINMYSNYKKADR